MTLLYGLCNLLPIPPSVFSLYHFCTRSASSHPSSASSIALFFLHVFVHLRFLSVYFLSEPCHRRTCGLLLALSVDLSLDNCGVYPPWRLRGHPTVCDYCCYYEILLQHYILIEASFMRILFIVDLLICQFLVFTEIYHCLTLCRYWFMVVKPLCYL